MIMYKCDRCGKIQAEPFKKQVVIYDVNLLDDDDAPFYDICEDCVRSFGDWINYSDKYDIKGYGGEDSLLCDESTKVFPAQKI